MGALNALDFGPGGSSRFARNAGRSVTGEAVGSIRYPSPFFDIAHTYLPSSFKTMLRWCRYYFLTNPIINAVCYKMAEYPVTDLVFDSDNESLRNRWKDFFFNSLNFKKFEVEAGLDYHAYGNAFISIYYPFIKMLQCNSCKKYKKVKEQKYVFRDFKFIGKCGACGHYGPFKVQDHYIRSIRDIRLIRWNPEHITIQHNEATGENRYYYTIPPGVANDVRMGKRHIIEEIPQLFVEALRNNKALLFSRDNIYHLRRPTIAQKDKGWGLPMILPVLKQTFYLQVLQKAQEAIAIEHIVPMRILFPQSASSTSDVYSTVNLTAWRDKIEQELVRWRLDNNYVPILPIPVGQQTLGASGKALMLSQEYRAVSETIISGMQVPIEFFYGGMSYSGSNVSMRILENHFLSQKTQSLQLVSGFIMPNVGAFMGWDPVPVRHKRFKMADDLQRSALYLQLNQAGKLSDQSLMEEMDWEARKESERILEESKRTLENQRRQALSQATIQGESQLIMAKYQMRAQMAAQEMGGPPEAGMLPGPSPVAGMPGQASPVSQGQMMNDEMEMANSSGQTMAPPPPPGGAPPAQGAQQPGAPAQGAPPPQGQPQAQPPPGQAPPAEPMQSMQSPVQAQPAGFDLLMVARRIASWLSQLPAVDQQQHLATIKQKSPQLHDLVMQTLRQTAGAEQPSNAAPPPEQRPPMRGPEAATS